MAGALPKNMTAILKDKPQSGWDLTNVPVPTVRDEEVLIKVERASLCGSDIAIYEWKGALSKICKLPFIPGHECVGQIVRCGKNVTRTKVGDRVCVDTHVPCQECWQCKNDRPHTCLKMGIFGHHQDYPGCFAEYVAVDQSTVYVLKSNLSPQLGAIMEPFGVSYRCVEEADPKNQTVLVLGTGPIGAFAIGIAKYWGASRILAVDISPERLEIAKKMGADVAINGKTTDWIQAVLDETDGNGTDVVIEASGVLTNTCLKGLRKGGTLVLAGMPKGPIVWDDPINDVMFKEVNMKTLHGRKHFHSWEESEKLLSSGAVDPSPVITHEFPLAQHEQAFAVAMSGEACKVILDPTHASKSKL